MRPLLKKLKNPLLRRYWFYTGESSGFGVTAYSTEDAESLLEQVGRPEHILAQLKGVVEDVDVSRLDLYHVRRNMGPPNFRGVWYPCLNLRGLS